MYAIYIDILFLINWIMNTLIFYCVSLVLNKRLKNRYMIGAGALAALVYCLLIVVPPLQKIPYGIYALFIPIPSILMLYRPRTYKTFFKQYVLSMMIAGVFGGVIFNIWYVVNGAESQMSSISLVFLISIGIVVTSCFYIGFYFIRRQLIFPAFEYTLVIDYKGKSVQVQSLLDTGNLLYTPQKHEPVLVAEYEVIKTLLSKGEQQNYDLFKRSSVKEIEEGVMNGVYQMKQLIPFNSVGCKNGFLWAIQADWIQIQKAANKVHIAPCIVGVSSERLFTDGQFHALLHPELILEGERIS